MAQSRSELHLVVCLQSSCYCIVIFSSVILLAVCIYIMNNKPVGFQFLFVELLALFFFPCMYCLLS